MAGKLAMGQKELLRGKVLEQVKTGPLTLKEAALRLKISYRQAKRLYRAYRERGDIALIHGNTGRRSNNRTAEEVRERALAAYRERYAGFGPTFAAEKLAEVEGITVCGETLRQWLIAAGLWERKRRSKPYRSRRERKACFGELVQFDGSHHDWFEGRRGKRCLMNMVDDATGTTLSMLFEQETTDAAMTLLSCWIRTKVREIRHTPGPVLRPYKRLCQQPGADG
jgi:transposase